MQVSNDPNIHSENLSDYLKTTTDKYIIYLRDFDLDTNKFKDCMKSFIGKSYGYISCIQSATDLFDIDGGLHCSETYMKALQEQGLFKNINSNKITPHTLMHIMVNRNLNHTYDDNNTQI